jgi:hypothetical protein
MKTIEALIKSMHKTAKVNQINSLREALTEQWDERKTPAMLQAEIDTKENKKEMKNIFREEIDFLKKLEANIKTLDDQQIDINGITCTVSTVYVDPYKKATIRNKSGIVPSILNTLK